MSNKYQITSNTYSKFFSHSDVIGEVEKLEDVPDFLRNLQTPRFKDCKVISFEIDTPYDAADIAISKGGGLEVFTVQRPKDLDSNPKID